MLPDGDVFSVGDVGFAMKQASLAHFQSPELIAKGIYFVDNEFNGPAHHP
jgi:hypothetical protein